MGNVEFESGGSSQPEGAHVTNTDVLQKAANLLQLGRPTHTHTHTHTHRGVSYVCMSADAQSIASVLRSKTIKDPMTKQVGG